MPARRPIIVVGAPIFGTVAFDVLEDWCRWFYHLGRRMPEYEFCTAFVPKNEQFRARNAMVEEAQKVDADYLLMIDDDMIVNPFITLNPTADYGFLARLLAHDKDICGALYYQRTGSCRPVLMQATDAGYRNLREDEITHGLQRVDVAGGGCLLIKMRVFDKIPMPYFEPEHVFGTDVQLCRKAAARGFEVWADTSIELGHVRDERVIITSRNYQQYAMESSVPGDVKRTFIAAALYEDLVHDAIAYTEYPDLEAMTRAAHAFIQRRQASGLPDHAWYAEHGRERIARQVWFNTQSPTKRAMTEFLLASIDPRQPLRILDFGCGIGIPAFHLAQKGHAVTACDLAATGTFQFLQWRCKQHGVAMRFLPTEGAQPPLGPNDLFDIIVAMDCLEHIPDWRTTLATLTAHLKPGGFLFSNNAILEDTEHPEHYPLGNRDFVAACLDNGLLPVNQVMYHKKAPVAEAQELTRA